MKPKSRRAPSSSPLTRNLLSAALACAAVSFNCSTPSSEPQLGSETNFLKHCDGTCGPGLSCLCGTCTKTCSTAKDCADLAKGAECLGGPVGPSAPDSCSEAPSCELHCTAHADCKELGKDFRCEAGSCRRGTPSCDKTLESGDFTRELTLGGVTRSYLVHVPEARRVDSTTPLLIDFHPMSFDAPWERSHSGFLELSDQEGFIAVWPQGLENSWDVGPCCSLSTEADASPQVNDLDFATALIRQLSTEACIDLERVYATGFSLGGSVAYYLGCQHAEIFSALAVSGMDLFDAKEIGCDPALPVSVISFRGTADTVIPYEGGAGTAPGHPEIVHDFQGADGTFQTWAKLDDCSEAASAPDANGCSTFDTCADDSEVILCTSEGAGQFQGDAAQAWQMLAKHKRD